MPVRKHQQPPLPFRPEQQLLLLLQRHLRRIVERRNRHQIQMMRRRHNIPQIHHPLPAVIEHHHLMPRRMTIGHHHIQPRQNLPIPVQQLQLPPVVHRQKIIRPVRMVGPLIGMASLVPAPFLHIIPRLRESRHQIPRPVQPRTTPRMIEMQMRQDHRMNILRRQPHPLQPPQQPARHQPQLFPVNVYRILRPDARIHQHIPPPRLQQQAVQPQRHPVLPVRGHAVLPSLLGHRPEHRTPVNLHYSVADDLHLRRHH